MTAIIDEIFELFARFGSEQYGEGVSLERHMLQSAAMAQSLEAPRHIVAAALLHDIGYFLRSDSSTSSDKWSAIEHESLGAAWLSRAFDEDVTRPIALHVQAKRYLCAVEPDYFEKLSEASRISLDVQGGIMNDNEAAAFAEEPAFEAALILRRCDDQGKDVSRQTQPLAEYRALLTACLRRAD